MFSDYQGRNEMSVTNRRQMFVFSQNSFVNKKQNFLVDISLDTLIYSKVNKLKKNVNFLFLDKDSLKMAQHHIRHTFKQLSSSPNILIDSNFDK